LSTIQLIPSSENREFTSSLGNWIGDPIWWYGPHYGQYGMSKQEANFAGEVFNFSLSYPYVSAPSNTDLILRYLRSTDPLPLHDLLLEAWITDGVYSLIGTVGLIPGPPDWAHYQHVLSTPPGWTEINTALKIKYTMLANHYDVDYLDNFSMTMSTPDRADHLPIMGVG